MRDPAAVRLKAHGLDARPLDGEPRPGADIVFFDAPDSSLLALLEQLRAFGAECVLAVARERGCLSAGSAWELMAAGASDVLAYEESPQWVARVVARIERWCGVEQLAASSEVRGRLVGESRCWRAAVRDAVEAARFTDAPVLLTGETGTGKELVARLIHALDGRANKAELVLLDCTTIVPTLSGSEFFGHERGAFTGAAAARDGAFALADEGTLFLDEVGELPLGLQSELLRVVQEGVYKRVGSNQWRKTSFRLVCATNRDLVAEAAAGRFRYDLLYRLAGCMVHLPSLCDRRGDVLVLARHFLTALGATEPVEFDPDVTTLIETRDYPGNVRELRQLMTRIALRHVGPGPITVGDVPETERVTRSGASDWPDDGLERSIRRAVAHGVSLKEIGVAASDLAVGAALEAEGGSVQRAAHRLGVTPRALQLRRAAGRLPPPTTGRLTRGAD